MRYLHRTWTGSGPEVDRKWTGSGPEVDRKWTGSGQEVDRKWTGSGPEMDDVMNKMLERLHVCVQTKKKGQYGGNIFPPPSGKNSGCQFFPSSISQVHLITFILLTKLHTLIFYSYLNISSTILYL